MLTRYFAICLRVPRVAFSIPTEKCLDPKIDFGDHTRLAPWIQKIVTKFSWRGYWYYIRVSIDPSFQLNFHLFGLSIVLFAAPAKGDHKGRRQFGGNKWRISVKNTSRIDKWRFWSKRWCPLLNQVRFHYDWYLHFCTRLFNATYLTRYSGSLNAVQQEKPLHYGSGGGQIKFGNVWKFVMPRRMCRASDSPWLIAPDFFK